MAKTLLGKFNEELKKGKDARPYDFICAEYWQMNKSELKAIITELLETVEEVCPITREDFCSALSANIEEWHDDELTDD